MSPQLQRQFLMDEFHAPIMDPTILYASLPETCPILLWNSGLFTQWNLWSDIWASKLALSHQLVRRRWEGPCYARLNSWATTTPKGDIYQKNIRSILSQGGALFAKHTAGYTLSACVLNTDWPVSAKLQIISVSSERNNRTYLDMHSRQNKSW